MKEKGLAYYLKYPERIGEVTDEQLDGLIGRYPYSQSLRWLKARKDLDSNSPGKTNSIRKAASYSDDLIFLRFQLLRDQSALEAVADRLNEEVPTPVKTEEEIVTSLVEEESRTERDDEPPVEKPSTTKKKKKKKKDEARTFEKQDKALTSSTPSIEEKQETVDQVIREFEEELSDFSKWLMAQGKDLEEDKKKSETRKKEKKRKKKKEKKKADTKSSKKNKKRGKEEKKNKLQKLIDHSIVEQDDLVTETYAQLVADQGHTTKAIELYEKLQLKMPEKSSYFARKIEELKNS